MSELSFLIELLLNHNLPKETKDFVAARIREVELNLTPIGPQQRAAQQQALPAPPMLQQAPSTLALMAKHGDIPPVAMAPIIPAPGPVAVIAQTPATVAALNSRNEAIAAALSDKVDKVSGRPRKW